MTSCSRHEYWCADFAIWVWQTMGINTAGLDAGSRSFKAYGQANGLLTNTPEVGDAVYFSDSAGTIKHVAIVTDVYNNGTIRSVSGDLGGSGSTMAQFADSSHSHYDAAYSSAIGAHSSAVGWNVAGYTRPAGVPLVGGLIAAKYNALGGTASFLGSPTTDELTTPNSAWGTGQYNHFQGGSIYWTQATGAFSVHGLILDEWAAIGWEQRMGFPTTDELLTPDGLGRYNHFQIGSIYWTPGTGAHEVQGLIQDRWASLGWENSVLGYPTADEAADPLGRRSTFQGGYIVYNAGTGVATAYHSNGTVV